jgi:hypothetical protein
MPFRQEVFHMRSRPVLLTVIVLGLVFAARLWAQPAWVQPPGKTGLGFQGYWMGIDPLDGGDSRRSLVQLDNGMFALAGRDTALTLCDGTERGFISFADGEVVEKNVLQSNRMIIACSNTDAVVVLRVRYDLAGNGVMIENTTALNGTPVTRIVSTK